VPAPLTSDKPDWTTLVNQLNLVGPGKALANNCDLDYLDDNVCSLLVDSTMIKGALAEDMLQKALQAYFARPIKLVFNAQKTVINTPAAQQQKAQQDKQQAAVDSIRADSNVQALQANFDARVLPDSIEPI
jgi:DNA polymerase-3 subunit gamma/tau